MRKRRLHLGASQLHLNPDLVFGDLAVGDVKYRASTAKWKRSDLYQLTTFATGFSMKAAGLFSFSLIGSLDVTKVSVGEVQLRSLFWDARSDANPADSASEVVMQAAD